MSPVGFEPTISVLERAKTVHALDRAATAIGVFNLNVYYLLLNNQFASIQLPTERILAFQGSKFYACKLYKYIWTIVAGARIISVSLQ
jgi:hypothetical protein